ncbi:Hsp20/alpha crystallin family protein [Oleidesulfovibrio sp.]|uniref:Hsp20/alpha crystallin family protein n=1 Tax=Oleidesulfovibrio sp. TaxID=2909707 RepID=UPI003A83ABD1
MPNLKIWKNAELQRIKSESDRMFDRLCTEFGLPSVCKPFMEPAVQMVENDDMVIVDVRISDVKPEEVEVYVSNEMLTLRYERNDLCACSSQRSIYETKFRLPCKVRTEEVEAEQDADVVRVRMPKCKRAESRRIPVKVKQTGE